MRQGQGLLVKDGGDRNGKFATDRRGVIFAESQSFPLETNTHTDASTYRVFPCTVTFLHFLGKKPGDIAQASRQVSWMRSRRRPAV